MRPADVMRARRDEVLQRRRQARGSAVAVEPVEVVARRGQCSKVYRVGSRLHLCQSLAPVHYRDSAGRWQEIDTGFRRSAGQSGVWAVMDRAGYRVVVPDGMIGWRHESADGGWMQMQLVEVDGQPVVGRPPPPRLVDGQVRWDKAAPGLDLWLVAFPHRSEMFKRYHGPGPRELVWRVTHSPGFGGRLQESLRGWDQRGDRLELETSREGDLFRERWTGRVSTVVDRRTRRREWKQLGPDGGPVVVDASISEPITVDIDDGTGLYFDFGPYNEWVYDVPEILIDYDDTYPEPYTIRAAAGFRFRDLHIPAGSHIVDASLSVVLIGAYDGTPTVHVYGDDVDNAPEFSDADRPHQMSFTTAFGTWVPVGGPVDVIDITDVVAEVVARPGWSAGNAMRFGAFQRPAGFSWVLLYDYNASPALAAQLDVTFGTLVTGAGGVVIGGTGLPGQFIGAGGVVVGGAAAVQVSLAQGRHAPPAAAPVAHPELDLMPWVGQRQATFRFMLFDGINGINKGEIRPVRDTAPVLTHNTTRTITRQITLQLDNEATELVNTVRDRVRVEMLLAGQVYPLGVYLFVNNPREVVSLGRRESTPALMDQMWAVDQQLDTAFAVASPEPVQAALRRLLDPFGLEVSFEPSVFSTTASWAPGAQRGQVVEQLALAGDWFPPWFDHEGVLRLVRSFDPGERVPTFDFDAHPVVLRGSVAEVDDLLEAPNRWVVVSNMAGSEEAMATPVVGVFDLPDEAPHSAGNRGFTIPHVVELPVGSGQQAAAIARNLGQQQTLFEQVELSTVPDPRHDSYDVVRWDGRLWLEIGWAMELVEGGEMRHTLRRAYTAGGLL